MTIPRGILVILALFSAGCRMHPQLVSGSAASINGSNPPTSQNNNVANWNCLFTALQGWNGGQGWFTPSTACQNIIHNQYSPGFSHGIPPIGPGGWTVDHIFNINSTIASPGISQGLGMVYTKGGVGDSTAAYFYSWDHGGATAAADEGHSLMSLQGGESNYTYTGIVTSSGATFVTASCTNDCQGIGDGRYLIDTHAPVATGTVTAFTDPSGAFTPGTLTIGSTVPASTFWGTLNADVYTPLSSTLGTGSTAMTFTVSRLGGSPTAGGLLCFGGSYHEQAIVSSVSGNTITANLRHAHEANSWVMEGGACGTFNEFTANDSSPNGQLLRYPFDIIGSTDTHTLVYRWFQYSTGSEHLSTHLGAASIPGASFNLWPGAEVLDINGGFTLEPNNVTWNAGDTIEQPHHYATKEYLGFHNLTINNPQGSYAGGLQLNYHGLGISGGSWFAAFGGLQMINSNPESIYVGHGGHLMAPNLEAHQGIWGPVVREFAPEGPAFLFGCPIDGCSGVWPFLSVAYAGGGENPISIDARSGAMLFGVNPTYNDRTHTANHVVCWTSSNQLGACSTQPDSTGACNCSLP